MLFTYAMISGQAGAIDKLSNSLYLADNGFGFNKRGAG